jgi:hypothetical protein
MEIPAKVMVHNPTLGVKGQAGTLVSIADGYFEVNMPLGGATHRILFPVAQTVLIYAEALPEIATFEVER